MDGEKGNRYGDVIELRRSEHFHQWQDIDIDLVIRSLHRHDTKTRQYVVGMRYTR